MKVKAILFDLDGTIFDITERDAFARYKALNELGYDISLDEVRQRYHYGTGRLGPVKELGIEFTGKQEEEYIKVSFAHFTEREALNLTRIHNGAHNVLCTLSKRFRLVIVTSRDDLSSTKGELDDFDIDRSIDRFASNTYTTVVNGEPYNSTTTQSSAEPTQSGEIRIEDTKAYQCVFGQNYTLLRDSENVTYPSRSAAVSDYSVPGGLYKSVESTLSFFENVLSGIFPKISNLPATINLDYNVSSFLYRVCYPQWDGYPLEHDPTYIAYLTPIAMPEISPPLMLIIGAAIAGSTTLIVALLDIRKTRRMLPNKSGVRAPSSLSLTPPPRTRAR